jgi:hypothetical protein
MMKDGAITSPCESFTYGEVEDYTLSIQSGTAGTTCAAPSGLATSAIGTTGATLSWTAITGASNYTLQYKKTTSTSWTSVSTANTSIALSGLSSSTTFNWQVKTNCTTGSSAYVAGANFTTQAAITTSCTDTYEANNSFSAAKIIAVNTNISALLSTSTDVDWFKFSNSSTAKNIRVTLSNLPADYDLRLYNSAGTLLSTSANGGNAVEQIKYNNAPVGTYYIRVYGYNGVFNATACYTLRADIASIAFKQQEGADEFSSLNESVLELFPNPTNDGLFYVTMDNEDVGIGLVTLTDASGKVIQKLPITKDEQFFKTVLDVNAHGSGCYFVTIELNGNRSTKRVVFTGQ